MNLLAQRVAYQQSQATADESRRCLLAAFDRLGVPQRMVDFGCGAGHLCEAAAQLKVDARGYDLLGPELATGYKFSSTGSYVLQQADLTKPFDPSGIRVPADLVLCLEVGEHLPESAAETLCASIARATAPGGVVLFSAATPGQGGSGHLNEQPNIYWLERLAAPTAGQLSGLVWDQGLTRTLRDDWAAVAPSAWWYGKNLLVLRKQEAGND